MLFISSATQFSPTFPMSSLTVQPQIFTFASPPVDYPLILFLKKIAYRKHFSPLWIFDLPPPPSHKMVRCTNRVRIQQNLIIELQILKRNLCEENV